MMPSQIRMSMLLVVLVGYAGTTIVADDVAERRQQNLQELREYFRSETQQISDRCLTGLKTIEDWTSQQAERRRQLYEMLGLDPLPPKTDLKPVVVGRIEKADFVVERIHFQSLPGFYVTANFYLPKTFTGKLPTVLYVCGHGKVVENGISYGNKTHYHFHGSWFARNGYACLIIDTVQLGEIEGVHHGTHNLGRWWWVSRGYTPAGAEAWNCIRSLDYLQTRPEVDGDQLAVTGRSGGGAYSWWISALDERIKAAVPVAGITDLQNHVVDGVVAGHCDCMYFVNTYRWDYPEVAALNFPRPLLIGNTDRDPIFPLDGVMRTYLKCRRLYDLAGKPDQVALNITAGGHVDTQELQVHAFRWIDEKMHGQKRLVPNAAERNLVTKQELKVFETIPADQRNTSIDETFVPKAPPFTVPSGTNDFRLRRDLIIKSLQEKTFRGWPDLTASPKPARERSFSVNGLKLDIIDFESQPHVPVQLWLVRRADRESPESIVLNPLDQDGWMKTMGVLRSNFPEVGASDVAVDKAGMERLQKMLAENSLGIAFLLPRGVGPADWNATEKDRTHILRRYYLLGQTLEGMQAWDIRRAMQLIRGRKELGSSKLALQGRGAIGLLACHASLFEPACSRVELEAVPLSHRDGPALLNVLKFMDVPDLLALVAERSPVTIHGETAHRKPLEETARILGWAQTQFQVR